MINRLTSSRAAGLTLIELIVGIAILAVSLALALPSYKEWIQNTHIRNAAESIQNGMQRARAEAVSRNARVEFTLGGDDALWTITDITNAGTIEQRSGEDISQNVTLDPSPPLTITFSGLGTVTPNADGTASITQIDVSSSALTATESRELRITVGVGGNVRMCDPDPGVEITDPRHC